jgi:uncharacterized protein (TIGR03067 family)
MKKHFLIAVLIGLAVVTFSIADDAAGGDKDKLRGEWTTVGEIDSEGKVAALAADDPKHFTLEFVDAKLSTKTKKRTIAATFMLDESKSPKTIDLVRPGKGGKELVFHGIYALDGKRLKFCLAGPNKERPKEFKKGEDIEFAVELKRVKG